MEPNSPNLIQLEITSLTKSRKNTWWESLFKAKEESYCLVLEAKAEQPSSFKLPIIIGHHEAMTMAVVLEGMKPQKPLPIDLLQNATNAFGYTLDSIVIDKIEQGIFNSTLRFSSEDKKVELDSRTSDAITLALKYEAPIYVRKEVADIAGVKTT